MQRSTLLLLAPASRWAFAPSRALLATLDAALARAPSTPSTDAARWVDPRTRPDELHESDASIEHGDRSALSDRPGAGSEPSKNGQGIGVVPGSDFAASCFPWWLGERPIDVALRDRLLEGFPTRAPSGNPDGPDGV